MVSLFLKLGLIWGFPTSMDTMVVDVGPSADWVKINVRKTKDCFEVYALVPWLLREEVHVQSDLAGRLVISGESEQLDNPWGVTPFKKLLCMASCLYVCLMSSWIHKLLWRCLSISA
ncbi:PREDICTED: AT-rich interactive domain-containing protein 5-like isoform X2 [Nelumbo nucifera]|uniref:AT-rich interactive domain-containing protein 5-like isoform X2 n=1 Tax=Nelumbo nucifera TaxID=4432 RepID=A0A1U8AT61_NELNU|nr:PREDICTED: AT-rich interactive domain-containing protein 5-like isoform X2 [Nelumbo nucifera]